MLAFLKKLKLPLEIGSVVVGIVLGITALWNQLKPAQSLVADVVATEARLPADILETANSLPERVQKAFAKDEAIAKLLPERKVREAVAEKTKDILERHSLFLGSDAILHKGFIAITVHNEGERPLKDVRLVLRYAVGQAITVIAADGSIKNYEAKGVLDLGDLPPRGQIKVFGWGLALHIVGAGDVIVSSQDGVGEVRILRPVPEFIWRSNGVFFSYQHTTYFLLAVVLCALGGLGIARHRLQRSQRSAPSDAA